jgi:purine-binding chemotaxis protein CheW
MGTTIKNYYKILQVESSASQEAIEVAYRKLAFRYHPDRNPSADANLKMQEVNEAYNILRHPIKRAQYDREHYKRFTASYNTNSIWGTPTSSPLRRTPSPPPPRTYPPVSPVKPWSLPEHQVVSFFLENRTYSFDVQDVDGVIMMQPLITNKHLPNLFEGIILSRGHHFPVLDLRKHLLMTTAEITKQTRIVLTHIGNYKIGFIVDAIGEILKIPMSSIESPPNITDKKEINFIKGIIHHNSQTVILLEPRGLLSDAEFDILTSFYHL